jgi:DNA-binding XRE family transcriptional regulator
MRREAERRLQAQMALGRQEFAARLRRLREQHDPPMTQEKAAAFLDVPARSYVRWENEEVDASLASRERSPRATASTPRNSSPTTNPTPAPPSPTSPASNEKVDRALAILEAQPPTVRPQTHAPNDVAHFARKPTLRSAPMPSHGPRMLAYIGSVAREARKQHGRKQIHVAYTLDVSESTIRNFELGRHWPRNPDATVQAYADELDLDPYDLWAEALRRWQQAEEQEGPPT